MTIGFVIVIPYKDNMICTMTSPACIHQTADVWVQLLAPVQKNPVPRASWLKAVRTNDGARDHRIANAVMYNMPKYLYWFFESVWDVWRI